MTGLRTTTMTTMVLTLGLAAACPADDADDTGATTGGTEPTTTSATTTSPTTSATTTSPTTSASTSASTTASGTDDTTTDADSSTSADTTGPADGSSESESSTTEAVVSASANLEPRSDSTTMGTAVFTVGGDGTVELVIELEGVTPVDATHALHIHEVGDCSAADGTSTGDHWNPKGTTLGELGTVEIDADGAGTFTKSDAWTVGTGGFDDVVGHSIIIHADPAGGTRIACGVIELD